MLGLQVDTVRLFENRDPLYEVWLNGVIDRIHATKKRWDRQQEKELNKKK